MQPMKRLLLPLLLLGSAAAETPAPRGDRWLGVGVTNPKDGDYAKAFEEAQKAGLRHNVLSFDWRDLETKPGEFKPEVNYLAIANAWYPPRKIPVHLMLRPLHTNQDARPEWLKDKPLDDPAVIAAFGKLLDWFFAQIPDLDVPSISIGSESDMWLSQDEKRFGPFRSFLKAAAERVRKLRPGVRVASELTLAGMRGRHAARLKELLALCDVCGASDYPLTPENRVLAPDAVALSLKDAVAFAGGKPVFFYQLGYPSGAGCGSTEEKQAQFIREMFKAWDAHARAVAFVNITWSEDVPAATVDGYTKYYQYDTKEFRDFLGTLGLRFEGGKPKAAWGALEEETKKRGW